MADREMRPRDRQDGVPWGVSESKECWIEMPHNIVLAFSNYKTDPLGCTYIRMLDSRTGGELLYWSCTEWQEEPENVMGAIMGALCKGADGMRPGKFYKFADDCDFPTGTMMDFE
jgi:hypothetical protein